VSSPKTNEIMKAILWLCVAVGAANLAQANPYNASLNQARRAVNQTEAASQRTDDSISQPPAAAPAPAPTPVNPVLAATMQNIANLKKDLAELNTNTPPTAALTNDLTAAATGTQPSPEIIAKLAGDLQAAIAGKPGLQPHYQKLAQYLHAVANGAHLAPDQFQTVSDNFQQILENGGAAYGPTFHVINDLKVLARETK